MTSSILVFPSRRLTSALPNSTLSCFHGAVPSAPAPLQARMCSSFTEWMTAMKKTLTTCFLFFFYYYQQSHSRRQQLAGATWSQTVFQWGLRGRLKLAGVQWLFHVLSTRVPLLMSSCVVIFSVCCTAPKLVNCIRRPATAGNKIFPHIVYHLAGRCM